jgi:O-antigen/teichoic acid export membrane protein
MMKKLAGNAAALAAGGAVAQLAFISIEIAIARQFLSSDFGVFAAVQAIALTGLIILDFGSTWWAIESGSREPETIPELLGTTIVVKLLGFVIIWPLAAFGLGMVGYDERTVLLFVLFFLYTLSMAIQDSLSAVYTARQTMAINALFQGGVSIVIAFFVAVVIFLGYGLFGVVAAYVIGGGLVSCIWFALTIRHTRPTIRLSAFPSILRGSYLYGLTGLLNQVFRRGDILLLSIFSSLSQVGVYAAAVKLLDFAYKIPLLGAYVVSPELFKQEESDASQFRKSADIFLRFNIVVGSTLAVACFHSSEFIIVTLFGMEFERAIQILRILSASFALKFIHYALQTILTTRRRHSSRTRALTIATVFAAIGHIILIPKFGGIGAAVTVVLSELLLSYLYIRGLGDTAMKKSMGLRITLAVVVIVLACIVPTTLGTGQLMSLALGVGLSLICFTVLGHVKKSEVVRILDALFSRERK